MEAVAEEAPKVTRDRPKGRPKKDSTPPEALLAKAFPQPPRAIEKGGVVPLEKFWAYRKSLAPEFLERLTFYVNREWPAINVRQNLSEQELLEIEQKKRKGPPKYVGQYTDIDPDNWRNHLLRYHGSGDYKIYLNDTGVRGNPKLKSINICRAFVSLRDDEFPPVIEDLSILDINDPINKGYILQLRSKGTVLPGDAPKEGQDDMAATQALETVTNAFIESVKAKPPSDNDNGALLVDLMKQSELRATEQRRLDEERHQREIDALTKRLEASEKSAGERTSDPIKLTNTVIEMAKTISAPKDDKTLELLMQMMKSNEERALQDRKLEAERHARDMDTMNRRLEAQEKREAELREMERQRMQAQIPATAAPAPNNPADMMTTMMKFMEGVFKFKSKLEENIPDGSAGSGNAYVDAALELGPKILDTITTVASSFKPVAGTQALAPGQPQQQHQSGQQNPQQQNTQEQNEVNQSAMYARAIEPHLIAALHNGKRGEEFAALIMINYGDGPYQTLVQQGEAGIMTLLQSAPDVWGKVQRYAARVPQFLAEFLNVEGAMQMAAQMRGQQQQPIPQRPVQPPPAGRPANQARPTVVDGTATEVSGGRTIISGDGKAVKTRPNGPVVPGETPA